MHVADDILWLATDNITNQNIFACYEKKHYVDQIFLSLDTLTAIFKSFP